jgi:uncharacterized damage-inducible protein DinB
MKDILADLFGHMEWADAELWRALLSSAPASADERIRERLHHLHLVQHGFLAIVRHETFVYRPFAEFGDILELRDYARDFHAAAGPHVAHIDAAALDELHVIPWFKDPPLRIRAGDALMQAAMHSQYHRGQNATRLRELGGDPPMTDFIVWLWKGKPAAAWE